jgi:hypothetical protein
VLPYERRARAQIRKHFRTHIAFAQDVLSLALKIIGQDPENPASGVVTPTRTKGLFARTVYLSMGLYAKGCKQLRSIIHLCMIGLTDEAEVISRSLFETILALEFLVRSRVTLKESGNKVSVPKGKPLTTPFRTQLYLAHVAFEDERRLKEFKKTRGLKRYAKYLGSPGSITKAADTARNAIGPEWTSRVAGAKKYGGVTVRSLAESFGVLSFYLAVYSKQSGAAHGADALAHFNVRKAGEPFTLKLLSDLDGVGGVLVRSASIFLASIETVNKRLGLGGDEPISEMKELLRRQFCST